MMSYKSDLQNNNTDLQGILDAVNALPEGGGTTLPTLTYPAGANELLSGKELIDSDGNVITGTMPNRHSGGRTITMLDNEIAIPEGYYSGAGVIRQFLTSAIVEHCTSDYNIIDVYGGGNFGYGETLEQGNSTVHSDYGSITFPSLFSEEHGGITIVNGETGDVIVQMYLDSGNCFRIVIGNGSGVSYS